MREACGEAAGGEAHSAGAVGVEPAPTWAKLGAPLGAAASSGLLGPPGNPSETGMNAPLSPSGNPASPTGNPAPLSENPASRPGGVTIEVTAASFQDVVDRSADVPILVDFWAPWCEPCKTLGPMLERLAVEMDGRFVLAKIDIDREPSLAEAFRIQSVPTVLLLAGGQVVDGFVGVQPEARVRELLEPHLKAPRVDAATAARELAAAGRVDQAVQALRDHLRASSENVAARIALAEILLDAERADEAELVFAKVPAADLETDAARAVQARLQMRAHAGDLNELAQQVEATPEDAGARLAYGRALVAANRAEEGLEQMYEAALLDLNHDDGAPRKAMQEVFQALGASDPLTLQFQQRLSILLCG